MAALRTLVAPKLAAASALASLPGRLRLIPSDGRAPSPRAALHGSAPRPGARVALVSIRRLLPGSIPSQAGPPPPRLGWPSARGKSPSSRRCCPAAESTTGRRSTRPLRKSSEEPSNRLGRACVLNPALGLGQKLFSLDNQWTFCGFCFFQ
jgi:hypothetical protein